LSAVHVHLAVSDVVEPGPSQKGVSVLDILGNIKGEPLVDTVGATNISLTSNGCVKVASSIGRAATNEAMDDAPAAGILKFGGVSLVCERYLARTATMDGSIGACSQVELKGLGRASLHVGHRSSSGSSMAGEVVTRGI
jgi:hypothetical protein